MKNLLEKVSVRDITGLKLERSLLEELGVWIYDHMNEFDETSIMIFVMLRLYFTTYERNVVWQTFDEKVGVDFSELMDYLLEVLNDQLADNKATCEEIVYTFIKDESSSSDSLNFKYCTQQHLSEDVKWLMQDIVCGDVDAPDDIRHKCAELLMYTNEDGIGARYIGYLMGECDRFPDILSTICANY